MRDSVRNTAEHCPVEVALEVLGGKWKLVIVEHLRGGTHRFGELRRSMPRITQRMLTRQLRELETDGLVRRTVYPEVPPKVEYALTDLGHSLEPIVARLRRWGERYAVEPLGSLPGPGK
ncbi:winged helix-turn-helix transcriptional regulator [Amycolatopsis cihanbeyliensis]|uniref:HxlR family transcriptional regulator n=1 Tax=Amycolatopsis cihanbeyliensis TaxID=1128664 RepID=A0A542DCB8_AMYCI|nr:helix-turn-helix domain-containing protein [Amycolatopsis cihanbeyliensis]TQJ00716.1 HxlR family transcriptional regulator [Amycolatopsis cihanbeyliensis]